jgi:nucleoid-associated protein YgaU
MVKYGVVGALALAVLVAAMWDSSSPKKTPDKDGATVEGSLGAKPPTQEATLAPPQPDKPAPVAAQPDSKPIVEEFAKYEVKATETLQAISKKWLGDAARWKEILEYNKDRVSDPKNLHKGLTLVFPKSKMSGSDKGQDSATMPGGFKKEEMKSEELPASSDRKYVVKSGDTLYAIAAHELGKGSRWKEIVKLNNLSSESVKKGQTLILPPK